MKKRNYVPSDKGNDEVVSVQRNVKRGTTLAIFGLLLLIAVFGIYRQIDSGERGVVLRFGEIQRIMEPGPNFKLPLVDHVIVYEVRTVKYEVDARSASKDLQDAKTTIALNYHLDEKRVGEIYATFGREYEIKFIAPAIQETVKAATAQFNAEELITKRALIKDKIEAALAERLQPRGILVETLSITNFDFSEEFNKAIEAKVTAQQLALKAENDLKRIEIEAKQRVATATGEAEAIRIQAEAIQHQGGAEYVRLKAIEKWNGILPMITSDQSLPFIQIPGLQPKT